MFVFTASGFAGVTQFSPGMCREQLQGGGIHNPEQARQWLEFMLAPALASDPGAMVEAEFAYHFGPSVVFHYAAENAERIISDANLLGRGISGVFITLNPLKCDINRPVSADDVTSLCWLGVNINGNHSAWGCRSADWRERDQCEAVANDVRLTMTHRHGWPAPAVVGTGGGQWLGWSLDLPTTEAPLIARVLSGMHDRFSTPKARIDFKGGSPDFRLRLTGSRNAKGIAATINRAHRECRLNMCRTPEKLETVPIGLLHKIAKGDWSELPRKYEVSPWGNASAWRASSSSWQKGVSK